jgi:hypothetical protein
MNWSYVAGFFDGEGHVGNHSRAYDAWRISMAQRATARIVIEEIYDFLQENGIRSRIYENFMAGSGKYRGKTHMAVLTITKAQYLEPFLLGVLPFLIVKKERAELALKWAIATVAKQKASADKLELALDAYAGGMFAKEIETTFHICYKTVLDAAIARGLDRRIRGTNQFGVPFLRATKAAVDDVKAALPEQKS